MSTSPAEPAKPPWINYYHVILPDATGQAILLLPAAEGWRLPSVQGEKIWVSETEKIIALLRQSLGLDFDFTVLRYVAIEFAEAERWDRTLFVLEARQPVVDAPLGGQWVDRSMLKELPLAFPEQRAPLLRYLEENAEGNDSPLIDPRRSPWARPGWFATASAWIEQSIVELGYVQSGPVEQLRNWSISSLLYVPTTTGRLYFKAAAALPYFVNEPALVQTLAALYPEHVPAPAKICRDPQWLLMRDIIVSSWNAPVDVAPVLRAYGEMQRSSADHIDELVAAGCIDRRLPVLVAQIDTLIADPETVAALKPEEFTALAEMAPRLKELCAKVAAYQLPSTLLHGDLHLGNITQRNNGYFFFDWTDACISFPFFDFFLLYFGDENGDVKEPEHGRDAYLETWRDFESPERLLELWELARPLCALHHAISYLTIIKNIEPLTRPELFHGFPDNLHSLLDAMRP